MSITDGNGDPQMPVIFILTSHYDYKMSFTWNNLVKKSNLHYFPP